MLGQEFDKLDPGLRDYFGAIPAGHVGRGEGTFDVVGARRRWLWPFLAVLALDGIVFPAWERQIPFTVMNRPSAGGTVIAKRLFEFPETGWVMTDQIGITPAGLADRMGRSGFLWVALVATVVNGRLVLRSTGVTVRLGRLRVPLGLLSPRLTLVERREGKRQHISLRLHLPLLGTLYEYSGSFTYVIEPEV